ncbi:hypothetical protein HNR67_005536 [Crossiella cryophila]|uniref:Uncharacterized protein n=1 Tax=Crossiella cryophila TaxID=43355 RepID=A0A7W7FWB1_9PSEU|nr:hypothetical protein [Crossiella cryophila]
MCKAKRISEWMQLTTAAMGSCAAGDVVSATACDA